MQDPVRQDSSGQAPAEPAAIPPKAPRSRRGLFLPYILLLTLVLLWSAGWVYLRGRAATDHDDVAAHRLRPRRRPASP